MTSERQIALDLLNTTLRGFFDITDDAELANDTAVCVLHSMLLFYAPEERMVAGAALLTAALRLEGHEAARWDV